MNNTRTRKLTIGQSKYLITSDDSYLKAMRPGFLAAVSRQARLLRYGGDFEPRMVRLYETLVRPEDVVLDVGANIGCMSLVLAQLAQKVYAFEPNPKSWQFWVENIKNSGRSNCLGFNFGLGAEAKSATISYDDGNRSGAFVADRVAATGESDTITVKRLDDVLSEKFIEKFDFIKMDVEGYEWSVLKGGVSSIQSCRPVIQLELNSWCLNAFHRIALPDFLDFLLDVFPFVYAIEKMNYVDVHNSEGRSFLMRQNILEHQYKELVVAFDSDRLARFRSSYRPAF